MVSLGLGLPKGEGSVSAPPLTMTNDETRRAPPRAPYLGKDPTHVRCYKSLPSLIERCPRFPFSPTVEWTVHSIEGTAVSLLSRRYRS